MVRRRGAGGQETVDLSGEVDGDGRGLLEPTLAGLDQDEHRQPTSPERGSDLAFLRTLADEGDHVRDTLHPSKRTSGEVVAIVVAPRTAAAKTP